MIVFGAGSQCVKVKPIEVIENQEKPRNPTQKKFVLMFLHFRPKVGMEFIRVFEHVKTKNRSIDGTHLHAEFIHIHTQIHLSVIALSQSLYQN